MIEIFLFVLKIIGIILAVILGILIVALCLVLFVPIRYCGTVSVADAEKGTDGENVSAGFSCTWLLRIVRVLFSYEETVRRRVKVFWFTVSDTAREEKPSPKEKKRKEDTEKKQDNKRKEKAKQETGQGKGADVTGYEADSEEPEQSGQKLKAGEKAAKGSRKPEEGMSADVSIDSEQTSGKEKSVLGQKISNILYTIRNFCDKLKEMKGKGSRIWEFWNADYVVTSRGILSKELCYLLRHIKPRKLKGRLAFGFEDPSTTGYAMAAYGILFPIWNPDVLVEPDFERQLLQCDITIKGRVRLYHIVKVVVRILLSKDARHAIEDIRSGDII